MTGGTPLVRAVQMVTRMTRTTPRYPERRPDRRAPRTLALALAALALGALGPSSAAAQRAAATVASAAPAAAGPAAAHAAPGDFAVGDRLIVRVSGVKALTDTFTVRAGRVLELPDLPAIPLEGVRRAELQHHLRVQLARFVLDTATVEARALVRVGVLGEVVHPGYYDVAPDAPIADVLMRAGGLGDKADAKKISVRRGARELMSDDRLRPALVRGATLDDLRLRAGDEIVVGARHDWGEVARTGALVGGVLVGLLAGRRIF